MRGGGRPVGGEGGTIIAVTAAEMREIDRRTIEEHGVSGDVLMERAGSGATDALRRHFARHLRRGAVIVAGRGNNGGDALVIARHLRRRRVRCETFLVGRRDELSGDAARNLKRFERAGGRVRELDRVGLPALAGAMAGAGVVVDGLFGTGLRGPLAERSREVIETINTAPCPIFAVDVPSGLDADRGVPLEACVEATLTATFAFPKVGMLLHPGADLCGEIVVVDIGVAPAAVAAVGPRQRLLDPGCVASALPPRGRDTHKGSYGHVLVMAGARGKCGAAVLAARAGMRSGAGLVTIAAPGPALAGVVAAAPEVMTESLADDDGGWRFTSSDPTAILHALDGKGAVVFGPGIGTTPATRALTEWLVASSPAPLLIDADGLNCLAGHTGWLRHKRAPVVVTPHPGEMARLLSCATADVQVDRLGAARRLATDFAVVVVLKGACTVVASPDGTAAINPTGNPGMASGGMGDALAGMIGALLAQGLEPVRAAEAAVYWHGHAGDRVAVRQGEAGLLAGDLIAELPLALRELQDRVFEKDPNAP